MRGAAADAAQLQHHGSQEGCSAAQGKLGPGIVLLTIRISLQDHSRPCRRKHSAYLQPQAVQLLCRPLQRCMCNYDCFLARPRAHWLHQQALARKHRGHTPLR